MIRKDIIVAILLTFCLTGVLFFIIPSRSNPDDINYNAWADVNCDGIIDIYDAVLLANAFNSEGTPLDKSAFPFVGTMSKPAYDSGWTNISQGQTVIFPNPTNTTNVFVYMMGKTNVSASPYIHQIGYGGDVNVLPQYGAEWRDLTETSIAVHRRANDENWCQVRICIWKIPEP